MLNPEEHKRLEKAKAWWRPVAGYTASLCATAITFTVCFIVLVGKAELSEAISFFTAAIPSLAVFLGAQSMGRSYEKANDSDGFSVDPMEEPPTDAVG